MPRRATDPLSPRAFALAQQLRKFSGTLKRRLRAQADTSDLTPSQTFVLLRLETCGPTTTSALARAEGIRPQSMGTIVTALDAAGLVTGSPDPADGRQTILSLTDHSREWLAHGRGIRQDWLTKTIGDRLSPTEQNQLSAVMPLLLRLIEE